MLDTSLDPAIIQKDKPGERVRMESSLSSLGTELYIRPLSVPAPPLRFAATAGFFCSNTMWHFDSQLRTALLQLPLYPAELDLSWPQRGLVSPTPPPGSAPETHGAVLLEGHSESAPFLPELAYPRGNDLVATYPTTADRISMQVYWRIVSSSADCAAEGVEIVPSLQTDRLDATMRLVVSSDLAADELLIGTAGRDACFQTLTPDSPSAVSAPLSPRLFLVRRRGALSSHLELVYPSDDIASSWSWTADPTRSAPRLKLEHRIVWPFLEKGVIRRCRVRSLALPRENDELIARQAWQLFQASELPLTT